MKEELIVKLIEMLVEKDRAKATDHNIVRGVSTTESGYEKYLGKNVFIRTVTHHYTGNVTDVSALSLTLKDAAWIADDGRFNESLKDPDKFNEVEPFFNPVTVNLYSVCDITEIPKLITRVK